MAIPGTETAENPRGIMVEVYWEQDEMGGLCISGHSDETPVPPNIGPVATSAPAPRRNLLGRAALVPGVVLDPNQIINNNSQN